jgi:hypothetical protein
MKKFLNVFNLVNILLAFISAIVALLLFIVSYKFLPVFGLSYQLERSFILVFFFLVVFVLAKNLKWVFILLLVVTVGLFGYKFYNGHQNLLGFYNESRNIFNDLAGYKEKGNFVYTSYSVFYRDRQVVDAIDFKSSAVRRFAIEATNESFKKEQRTKNEYTRVLIQSFAVFKKINSNWNYVSDPADDEYFAKASESTKLLAGDCDDYSILMAAAIKSIGGKVRLTFIKGHIYPEIMIGGRREFEQIAPIITHKLFSAETKGKELNYYEDQKGNIWLNLDYTANYPGGSYMGNDIVEYIYP